MLCLACTCQCERAFSPPLSRQSKVYHARCSSRPRLSWYSWYPYSYGRGGRVEEHFSAFISQKIWDCRPIKVAIAPYCHHFQNLPQFVVDQKTTCSDQEKSDHTKIHICIFPLHFPQKAVRDIQHSTSAKYRSYIHSCVSRRGHASSPGPALWLEKCYQLYSNQLTSSMVKISLNLREKYKDMLQIDLTKQRAVGLEREKDKKPPCLLSAGR